MSYDRGAAQREHKDKYEALAQRIGVKALQSIIPATPARVQAALAAGDEHLNTIPLAMWDRAAGYTPSRLGWAPPSSSSQAIRLSWSHPWTPAVANGLSLAERVCTLKHVAIFHYAGPGGESV